MMLEKMLKSLYSELISDKEFSEFLHDFTKNAKKYIEETDADSVPNTMFVVTRHDPKEKFEVLMIGLEGWPPERNQRPDRYEMLEIAGEKYCEEMVKKKPSGEKCFPMAVFFQSEAWSNFGTMTEEDEKEYEKDKDKNLNDYGGTGEAIILAGQTMDMRTNMSVLPMKREKNKLFVTKPKFFDYDPTGKQELKSQLADSFYKGFTRALQDE